MTETMFDPIFARAGVLWTEIIEFIQIAEGSVAVALESYIARQLIRNPQMDSGQRKLLVHRFAIEGEIDSKTPLELFLAIQPDLTTADLQLIGSWCKSFVGLLSIVQIFPNGLEVMNWLTAKHYRIQFTDASSQTAMSRLKVGDVIIAQISPIIDIDWAILTPWVALGRLGRPKLAVAVGAFRQNYPHSLYSDAPELLAASWESVVVYHDRFVEFFGTDELTLTGKELETRIGEFQTWMVARQLDAAGIDQSKSIDELALAAGVEADDLHALTTTLGLSDSSTAQGQATAIGKMISPKVELPSQLKSAAAVTALSHPHWGQMFLADYPRLKTLLAPVDNQLLPTDLKFIHKCLADPQMNTFVWRRLATQFPQQLEIALHQTLELLDSNSPFPPPPSPRFNLDPILTKFNKFLEPDLPDLASVPLHLHELFQAAVLEVSKEKAKPKSQPKKSGFGAKS
ncbi:hypothetical protein [Chamaesiphon sp. VAR_48_metabat_135_sub]|uniref:hypothetical protein n=1 Tax=Chamaesiphon sp. VAR_48_metabat_135_sub TaxID=2964699 RepID=UPI002869FB20|nr:hypothetical protein [Chamaesiphon sp. VAR_48_metabat_135_sub]